MATWGFFDGTVYSSSNTEIIPSLAYASFMWNRIDYSPVDNTSTIQWEVDLSERGAAYSSNPYRKIAVSIDGKAQEYVTYSAAPGSGEFRRLLTSASTIEHNFDGSKTCEVMVQIQSQAYKTEAEAAASAWTTGIYETLKGTITLDSFDRIPKILTAPNFTDEDDPEITYSNPLGEDMAILEACIANSIGTEIYVPYREISKTGNSYTFNLTISNRDTLREAAGGSTLPVRFYIRYWLDGQMQWTFVNRTMTLDDTVPTLNPVVRDEDTDIVALTKDNQKVILGYSNIYAEVGATPPAGAAIISQKIKCGTRYVSTTSGTFINAETNVLEFSVRDSRGNVASTTKTLEVIPYIKPTCNQTVRLNLDGSIALTVKGNYFDSTFGDKGVANTLSIQNRWRESGNAWSDWNTIDVLISEISNNTYTLTATMSGFDPSGTYEFQSKAVDKLSYAESAVDSVVLKPIFDWGKYDFNFNVPVTIEGNPLMDYVIEYGTEAMGTNGTWYWEKWKSGKATCYGCRNYGNMGISREWGSLYVSPDFNQSLPSGLFKSTPESIQISLRNAGNLSAFIIPGGVELPTKDSTGTFCVARGNSLNASQVYISFDIKGRWK